MKYKDLYAIFYTYYLENTKKIYACSAHFRKVILFNKSLIGRTMR